LPFSVSTWNYLKPFGEKAVFNDSLAQIRSQGFGVELWLDWYADPTLFLRSNWEQVKELCDGLPGLSAHTAQVHGFSLKALVEEMDFCAFLGADPLVCHPRSFGLNVSTWDQQSNVSLRKEDEELIGIILSEAAGRSIRLALENGPLDLLQQVLEAMADHPAGDHLGICIDTGHANMHGQLFESPAPEFIQYFRQHLIHLHLHDNGGVDDEHQIPGQGTIDWTELFEKLNGLQFKEEIVFELWSDTPPNAAEQARAFVQNLYPEYPSGVL
jgi:sugar phosphate isomerase/epimerase